MEARKLSVYAIDFDKLTLFNGIHCASIFEIDRIVAYLVEVENCDKLSARKPAWVIHLSHGLLGEATKQS